MKMESCDAIDKTDPVYCNGQCVLLGVPDPQEV